MMMRKRLLAACMVFALAIGCVFGLAACGEDFTPNFSGTWRVTSMQDASGSDLTATIEQLDSANMHLTLTLGEEKDASFDLAGQTTLTGTWKPTGASNCVISFEGYEEIPASLADGVLSFEEDGQTMSCQRQE